MTRSAAQPAPAVTPPERWGVWHTRRRRWVDDGGAGIAVHTRAEAEAIARDGSRCTPGIYVAGDLDAGPPGFGAEPPAEIEFFAAGCPKGQPRARAFARKMGGKFVARMYDAGTAEGWKGCIALAAREHLPPEPIAGPVALSLDFTMPRPRGHYRTGRYADQLRPDAPDWHTGKPDADNLAKAVMDALSHLRLWRDDTLASELRVVKRYGDRPGCAVRIRRLA